jgi:hypothetical protein
MQKDRVAHTRHIHIDRVTRQHVVHRGGGGRIGDEEQGIIYPSFDEWEGHKGGAVNTRGGDFTTPSLPVPVKQMLVWRRGVGGGWLGLNTTH